MQHIQLRPAKIDQILFMIDNHFPAFWITPFYLYHTHIPIFLTLTVERILINPYSVFRHSSHVETADNFICISLLHQIPAGCPADPPLFTNRYCLLRQTAPFAAPVFDFHKDEGLPVPGNQIDLSYRTAIVFPKNPISPFFQYPSDSRFVFLSQFSFIFQPFAFPSLKTKSLLLLSPVTQNV